jgi:hypothetical protein
MSQDISGYGLRVTIVADQTFPNGFTVSAFAGDADPFDLPEIETKNYKMGLNGDLTSSVTAVPINVTLNVIPKSEDDQNLQALFNANRAARGKAPVNDVITMTGVYADGTTVTLINGGTGSYMPSNSISSGNSELKSRPYSFTFEDIDNQRGD